MGVEGRVEVKGLVAGRVCRRWNQGAAGWEEEGSAKAGIKGRWSRGVPEWYIAGSGRAGLKGWVVTRSGRGRKRRGAGQMEERNGRERCRGQGK